MFPPGACFLELFLQLSYAFLPVGPLEFLLTYLFLYCENKAVSQLCLAGQRVFTDFAFCILAHA